MKQQEDLGQIKRTWNIYDLYRDWNQEMMKSLHI